MRRQKRKMAVIAAAAMLSAALPLTALADWKQENGRWWYQYGNGAYAQRGIREIDGQKYLFDTEGYMLTGWQRFNERWYYLAEDGHMVFGWQQLDGKWYYLTERGMETGWQEIGGKRYYLDADGSLRIGGFEVDGCWYKTDASGAAVVSNAKISDDTDTAKLWSGEDGSLFRYNDQEKAWEYLPGKEESANLMMEKLFQDLSANGNIEAFETAARENLKGLMSDEDIEVYIAEQERIYMFDVD